MLVCLEYPSLKDEYSPICTMLCKHRTNAKLMALAILIATVVMVFYFVLSGDEYDRYFRYGGYDINDMPYVEPVIQRYV